MDLPPCPPPAPAPNQATGLNSKAHWNNVPSPGFSRPAPLREGLLGASLRLFGTTNPLPQRDPRSFQVVGEGARERTDRPPMCRSHARNRRLRDERAVIEDLPSGRGPLN